MQLASWNFDIASLACRCQSHKKNDVACSRSGVPHVRQSSTAHGAEYETEFCNTVARIFAHRGSVVPPELGTLGMTMADNVLQRKGGHECGLVLNRGPSAGKRESPTLPAGGPQRKRNVRHRPPRVPVGPLPKRSPPPLPSTSYGHMGV